MYAWVRGWRVVGIGEWKEGQVDERPHEGWMDG